MKVQHRAAVCRWCGIRVYQNLTPGRVVPLWLHRPTGSMYCDRSERYTADPADEGVVVS